jgi:hypothetical protein
MGKGSSITPRKRGVVVWLLTPAIVVIGSVGAGIVFDAISKLWAAEQDTSELA